jgi:hypothetical protein
MMHVKFLLMRNASTHLIWNYFSESAKMTSFGRVLLIASLEAAPMLALFGCSTPFLQKPTFLSLTFLHSSPLPESHLLLLLLLLGLTAKLAITF